MPNYKPADVLDMEIMGNEETMHGLFDHLRENDPVAWVDHPEYLPFWSLSNYDDIKSIGSQNEKFISAPRTVLMPSEAEDAMEAQFGTRNGLETLIHMDKPKHLKLRRVSRDWFLPRSINKLDEEVKGFCKEYVDRMEDMGGECDFVKDVALVYPLRIIMSILGLPRQSEETMLKLTQEVFGPFDPDLQRDPTDSSEQMGTLLELGEYFAEIVEDRKKNPADDLATVLANAKVDGEPMDAMDQMSYFIITATAGHDTTASVLGGGMRALLSHPDQLALWRDNPNLDDSASKELMRWASPVRHMVRTATEDMELRGKKIRAGDNIALWFPAANRDPEAYANPNTLDITRDPKKHLAFGYGAHMCLGMHLAVMEVARFYRELLPRLKHIELAGDPTWIHANFVGGLKTLPVRYEFNK
ncbi:MAG: cytochrome P450 [Halioglobus sp.]|jgi:cytochrome P450